jgi:hypothetical protein
MHNAFLQAVTENSIVARCFKRVNQTAERALGALGILSTFSEAGRCTQVLEVCAVGDAYCADGAPEKCFGLLSRFPSDFWASCA